MSIFRSFWRLACGGDRNVHYGSQDTHRYTVTIDTHTQAI